MIIRAYGFVGYDVEEEAKAAVAEMDRKDFKGRQLNVEISGGRPRTNLKNGKDTTKLHVSGKYKIFKGEVKIIFVYYHFKPF